MTQVNRNYFSKDLTKLVLVRTPNKIYREHFTQGDKQYGLPWWLSG